MALCFHKRLSAAAGATDEVVARDVLTVIGFDQCSPITNSPFQASDKCSSKFVSVPITPETLQFGGGSASCVADVMQTSANTGKDSILQTGMADSSRTILQAQSIARSEIAANCEQYFPINDLGTTRHQASSQDESIELNHLNIPKHIREPGAKSKSVLAAIGKRRMGISQNQNVV